MLAVDREANAFLYQQVVDFINDRLEAGTLGPGDKLPSLRKLAGQLNISIPTVKQAYIELERQGKVSARPQSGFYVRPNLCKRLQMARKLEGQFKPETVVCRDLIESVYEGAHTQGIIPLGLSNPVLARPAAKALNRALRRVMARAADRAADYGPIRGYPELRRQLAYRYLEQGLEVDSDEIIVTNGAQEAISLALKTVAGPGDVIAVETPSFFGVLEMIESLGMLALEIPTCTEEGVCLDALRKAVANHPVKACLFSPGIHNPTGASMPDSKCAEMVAFLEDHDIPLITDDVYSELFFETPLPKPAQAWSRKGLVLTASSFSKTAAPGYRVGWLVPGIFHGKAYRLKRALSASSPLLPQLALTEFIRTGEYDNQVRRLRKELAANMVAMSFAIAESFPEGTYSSQPCGGSVLWIELPERVDSIALYYRAMSEGIGLAPGSIFSPGGRHPNFIRLSFGQVWSPKIANAVKRLGELARQAAE